MIISISFMWTWTLFHSCSTEINILLNLSLVSSVLPFWTIFSSQALFLQYNIMSMNISDWAVIFQFIITLILIDLRAFEFSFSFSFFQSYFPFEWSLSLSLSISLSSLTYNFFSVPPLQFASHPFLPIKDFCHPIREDLQLTQASLALQSRCFDHEFTSCKPGADA